MTICFDKLNNLKSLVSLNRFRTCRDFYSCCIYSIVQRSKTRREEEGKVENA